MDETNVQTESKPEIKQTQETEPIVLVESESHPVRKVKRVVKKNRMPKPQKPKDDEYSVMSKEEIKEALLAVTDPKNISENIMGFDVISELKKEKGIISKKISEPPKLKNAFLKEYVETENFGRQHFVGNTPTVDKRSKEYANCEAFKKKATQISGRSSESNSFTF